MSFKWMMAVMIGLLLGSVLVFAYRVSYQTPVYPSYDDYVPSPSMTMSDGSTIAPTEQVEQETAYEAATLNYNVKNYQVDQWTYAGLILVLVLLIILVVLVTPHYPVLGTGILLGLILAYLATRGTVSFDALSTIDPEIAASKYAMIAKLVAAAIGFAVVALIDIFMVERSTQK